MPQKPVRRRAGNAYTPPPADRSQCGPERPATIAPASSMKPATWHTLLTTEGCPPPTRPYLVTSATKASLKLSRFSIKTNPTVPQTSIKPPTMWPPTTVTPNSTSMTTERISKRC